MNVYEQHPHGILSGAQATESYQCATSLYYRPRFWFEQSIATCPQLWPPALPVDTRMSFNQTANVSPASGAGPVVDDSLEVQLRGMILSSHQPEIPHEHVSAQRPGASGLSHHIQPHQQRQTAPFFGNMGGPITDPNHHQHSTTQTSGLPPMFPMNSSFPPTAQGLPPSGFFSQGGELANVPVSPVTYRAYPGPPPGLQTTDLPPQTGLQYFPTQRLTPQSQSPNMSPTTPPRQDYVLPHLRHIYRQQPSSPQHDSPPRQRQQPPQMTPIQARNSQTLPHNFSNPQNTSRVPPPTALDHFPPLGTQPAKAKPLLRNSYQQQSKAQNTQQRMQYQPLPVNTHNFSPPVRGGGTARGGFRNPNYTGRPQQQYIEQVSAEQSYYLDEFSKRIIAEAAPPEIETSVKHALLKRLEAICKEVSPDAKLIPFGSLVSKYSLPFFEYPTIICFS